ncbi:hypothetical protein JW960_15975 [candidate division KSB1 bacterium]|nr:hypothetical protein [candidate division KSB1 bacterium]
MHKSKRFISIITGFTLMWCAVALTAGEKNNDNDSVNGSQSLRKPAARLDEAVGVMTKGQLCNLTMNYGQISDTRLEDPGNRPTDDFFNFRYPKVKPYGSMVDDFALLFAVEQNSKNGNNGNVIDGYTNNGNEDWIAKDGSLGKTHYDDSGDHPLLTYVDGTTPYLAHSDLPQTWPLDNQGNPFWPGYFRRNPETGQVYEGEFASDRDVYGVFTDANNLQGNSLGIEIEQMAYCYGRTYAEDFQFYEFFIHNTGSSTVENAWIGIYQDPDCSDYGEEILISPAGHSVYDPYPIIMQRDFDGDLNAATLPNSVGRAEDMDFGTIILETPFSIGLTDFHYYVDTGPTFDDELWPIISSQPTDPDIAAFAAEYFHGADPHLDDISLITLPQDWVHIMACGPFDLAPGDTAKFTIAVVVGNTDADFVKNCDMAIQMFEKGFVGPAAPPAPEVWGVPGDNRITLYWDNSPELKPDPLTDELDFEGYKIYRSQDNGATWGDEITDSHGNVVGYVPIAQFDIKNAIEGDDPMNPNNYLGDNTGLQYFFVDSTIHNGIAYSYTVTAFDHGDPASSIPSFETAKGVGVAEKHFVTITPRPNPSGYIPSSVSNFYQVTGKGRGNIHMNIIDPQNYSNYKTDNRYTTDPIFKIELEGSLAKTFSLYDSTANNRVLASSLPLNTGVLPVISDIGISLSISSEQKIGGVKSIVDGFGINVNGAGRMDSTKSWYVSASEIPSSSIEVRSNDYEIRFTASGSIAYSRGRTPVALMPVPFEVWRVFPDTAHIICEYDDRNLNNTFESNEFIYICNVPYPDQEPAIGDPIDVNFPADLPIQLTFSKAAPSLENPAGGSLPVTGQKVTIACYSSFSDGSGFAAGTSESAGDKFVFSINEAIINAQKIGNQMDNIRAVPNPYVVTSLFDPRENARSLKFMYLPDACDITIYSLSGVKIKEIEHSNGTGMESWDMTNEFGQDIAFGVYVYVVSTDDGNKKVGKLAIIK